jgi:hypothetical protein
LLKLALIVRTSAVYQNQEAKKHKKELRKEIEEAKEQQNCAKREI